jgi:CHAD domain-containing protein
MSYRIDPRLPLTSEVRRIATEEIDSALGHLAAVRDNPDKAMHECRKRLKSVRALMRLVRSGDEAFARAENARYREISARLAGAREAAALIETLDRLEEAFPGETADGALGPVRDRLIARRVAVVNDDLAKAIAPAVTACKGGLRKIGKLALPDQPERAADVLADGAGKTIRRARKALRKAKDRGEPEHFHDLRKAVKAHAMHLSLLRKFWPSPVKARRKAIDALGGKLGELHDIFVLRALLLDEAQPLGSRAETRLTDRLAKRMGRKLSKTCLTEASKLFNDDSRRSAKKLIREIERDQVEKHPAAGL